MKTILTVFCVVGLSVLHVLVGTAQSEDVTGVQEEHENHYDNRDVKKVVFDFERKLWSVAANLYTGVNKTEVENVIFSPLSLTSSMVMLNAGANGETAREIQTLFKIGTNSVRGQKDVLDSLTNQTKDSGVKFVSASRIYTNSQNSKLRDKYKSIVRPLGEVETLDFTQPKTVVAKINEWANNKTEGEISKIVEKKYFDKETSLVLLNALYFKAPWKHQFNKSETKKADFHINPNKKVQVDMMHISGEFPFAALKELEASAVVLHYKSDRLSMIIYLPNEGQNLSTLEKNLGDLVPTEIRNKAETLKISLRLPKFNISSSLDFKEILISLGVQKMFKKEEADFSKISESPQFHVSKVRQSVFFEVNEEGTEAAAVTDEHDLAYGPGPISVNVTRPFIFQIYDINTGAVLLSGRISNPKEPGHPRLDPQKEVDDDEPGAGSSNWTTFIAVISSLIVMIILAYAFFRAKDYFGTTSKSIKEEGERDQWESTVLDSTNNSTGLETDDMGDSDSTTCFEELQGGDYVFVRMRRESESINIHSALVADGYGDKKVRQRISPKNDPR